MKNLTAILAILLPLWSLAQQGLTLKFTYQPNHTYQVKTEQNVSGTVRFSGDDELMSSLEKKGVKNPQTMEITSSSTNETKTGARTSNGAIPYQQTMITSMNKDGENIFPPNTTVYGKIDSANHLSIDSIASSEIDERLTKALQSTVSSAYNQLNLPNKYLRVGDSLVVKSPLDLPIMGTELKINVTTTYLLLSIENGIGKFDVKLVYEMEGDISSNKFTATGTGNGVLNYDIANQIYQQFDITSNVAMKMSIEKMAINMDMLLIQKTGMTILQ